MYRIETYDFFLPEHLIAQHPLQERDSSRLMVIRRSSGTREHTWFRELGRFLVPGDLLIVNDSRVIPARLFGRKETGGRIEILLVRQVEASEPIFRTWECLLRPSRKILVGTRIRLDGNAWVKVSARLSGGRMLIDFPDEGRFEEILARMGHIPLPPYIKRTDDERDGERYQTIYARHDGSVAAPTAGLHFSRALMEDLVEDGIRIAPVTLHVGPGTFLPIKAGDIRNHQMHSERAWISEETCRLIEETQGRGHRVIAVGSTSLRVLESSVGEDGKLRPGSWDCDLYVYPGFQFRVADGLITNFHLPRSSLILLCSAFAGAPLLRDCYREAVELEYRFYSYGDAMLIV